jgi:hypothetical protein
MREPDASARRPARPDASACPSRLLEIALAVTFAAHGLAMLSMIAFLLPGLPGGPTVDAASRTAYVAAHPWLWRLGWLPWQLTALSDLLLAVALLRTPWIPRLPAIVTVAVTIVAILPDQIGQARWITEGVRLAEQAVRQQSPAAYLRFEADTYRMVGAVAATLYTLGALGWTWCFAAAGVWSRRLSLLSVVLWSIFAFACIGPLLPAPVRPAPATVGAANAVGFLLLQWWFVEVLIRVRRRAQ